jgi:uncharacterized protein YcbK (DUF882 family)
MKRTLLSRRRFIGFAGGLTGLIAGWPGYAMCRQERTVALKNLHTGEYLRATYEADGRIQEAEMDALNRLLRDHRTGDVYPIDVGVIATLWLLQKTVENRGTYEVISGYRSPATNAHLNAKSKGVAKRSLHMQGRAIDVRLPGTKSNDLRKAAVALRRGGVGYYAKANFVHLDTGRFRTW